MLLGWILFAIGVVGFGFASYWDIRYTEFPDWLPYLIVIAALVVRSVFSYISNDWSILTNSLIIGCIFLGFGLFLYFMKQWGDGDAWLLGSLGFLFPDSSGFLIKTLFSFPLTILTNFLFISLIYLIIYSIILGLRNRKIFVEFADRLKSEGKRFAFLIILFFALPWISVLYFRMVLSTPLRLLTSMFLLPFLLTFVLLFAHYAKLVEDKVFKKKIDVKGLKIGDVILKGKWKGLTKNEIEEIKKKERYVWIKEGVRFAPVFLFTELITIFYGDLIFIFF